MGKVKISCLYFCLLSISVWGQPISCIRDVRNNVVDTLDFYLFVEEATGNNDGYWVEKFIESTGLNPQGKYPWCAAYITYGFKVNGLEAPKYPARASSWFDSEHLIPNEKAKEGDLGSLYYQKLGRIGHIVSYVKPFGTPGQYVITREGNTNRDGSREGNKAAKKYRLKRTIHSSSDWISPQVKECRFYKCIMK